MEPTNYISDEKGNFYVPFQTDLITGYLPVELPKIKSPVLRWRGPKINVETEWYPVTSFMYDYQKHEVILRLFATADKQSIVIRPFTQYYGTGMSVTEAPSEEDLKEVNALGLTDIGTVHSHCTAKAFASGIDNKDEANWPGGLHLTVGNLDEKQYDLHARFTWDIPGAEENGKIVRKAQRLHQTPHLRDWFVMPEHVDRFLAEEEELERDIVNYILVKPADSPYPDWWKEKLIDPPKGQITWTNGGLESEFYFGMTPSGSKKKKKNGGNDIESFQRRRWAAWQRGMVILAEYPIARANRWTMEDFKPELRDKIVSVYPVAKEILEKIQAEIKRLELSEQDVFNPWEWGVETV
jgi:hypothetical protein